MQEENKKKVINEKEIVKAVLFDGEIAELVKKNIQLSEADKEIMLSPESKRWVLRKKGNLKLIAAVGISMVNPEFLWVNDHKMMNPYSDLDERGVCRGGHMHSMAIGYAPSGQLVGVSCSVSYLAEMVKKSALLQVIRNFPESGFNVLSADEIPKQYIGSDDKVYQVDKTKSWKYFEIDPDLGGIQVDGRHPAIYSMREKLLLDTTHMVATLERRILTRICQSHPAINISFIDSSCIERIKGENGDDVVANIPIYLCKRSIPRERLLEIQDAVAKGLTFLPSDIKIISHIEAISQKEEEDSVVLEEEAGIAEKKKITDIIENDLDHYYEDLVRVIDGRDCNMHDLTLEELKDVVKGDEDEKE